MRCDSLCPAFRAFPASSESAFFAPCSRVLCSRVLCSCASSTRCALAAPARGFCGHSLLLALRRFSGRSSASSSPSTAGVAPHLAPQNAPDDKRLTDDEAALIRCAQDGDNAAFDALVVLHQNKVFNLCRWNLGNDEDAADAAQDVFVRAWKALPRFRGDCALSTWLHRIAVNVISDSASRRQRAPLPLSNLETADGETAELEIEDLAADANPSDVALSHARRRAVQSALADLPQPQRAVLVLFDVQGHSYEDVAAILELPLGTVKSRLSRARLALRERLEAHRELWDE